MSDPDPTEEELSQGEGIVAYPDPTVTADQYAEKEKSGAPPMPLTSETAEPAAAQPPPIEDGEVVYENTQ